MDIFSGLMKGFGGFIPQDDPDAKILTATSDLNELREKEKGVYEKIGRKAISEIGEKPEYSELINELKLIALNIKTAEEKLSAAKLEKEEKQKQKDAEEAALEANFCPECGTENAVGAKFCNSCGSKLGGEAKSFCTECGAENPKASKFCQQCGASI